MIRLRQKLLPLVDVKKALQLGTGDRANGFVVVTQAGGQLFGAIVDNVFHSEEIVIKPMSSKLRHVAIFSGMTILGDGSVIMVIDPNVLAHRSVAPRRREAKRRPIPPSVKPRSRQDTVSLLIFRAASNRPKAVPLSLVSRIEEIDCRNIENADGRYIVQYRDALMPLLGFEAQVRIKKEGAQPFSCSQNTAARLGFLSTRFDIAEERLDVKMADIDLAYSAMRSLEATSPKSSTSGFFWQPEARSAARHERQGEIDK